MQLSSSAADVTDVSSRELSCKSGSSGVEGLLCAGHLAGPSRGRLGRQEACLETVLRRQEARLERPGGGRLWRQEPSGGRLGRQEARLERQELHAEAVWAPGPF